MRVNCTLEVFIGAALLGVAMGALTLGFALFILPPSAVVRTPQPWVFAVLTAVVVTLTTAKPFRIQHVALPRP